MDFPECEVAPAVYWRWYQADCMKVRYQVIGLLAVLALANSRLPEGRAEARKESFEKKIAPLLTKYCYDCHGNGKHKGDLALDGYHNAAEVLGDRKTWEMVLKNVRSGEMPPAKKPQPNPAERELISGWIDAQLFHYDPRHPDPGRVTIRRLNRAEYNNTVRDLVGVDFQPADDFPQDDVGYGFDNIGDVLSMPPMLLEKYLAAAEKIMDAVIVTAPPVPPGPQKFLADELESSAPGEAVGKGVFRLDQNGALFTTVNFPIDGDFLVRVRAFGQQYGPDPTRLALRLDRKDVKVFDVTAEEDAPQVYETTIKVNRGRHRLAAAYINDFNNPKDRKGKNMGDRDLFIEWVEVVPPRNAAPPLPPAFHQRLFAQPVPRANQPAAARNILGDFMRRAYRRLVAKDEVERLAGIAEMTWRDGESFEKGVKLALTAALVSPHFLFRGELQPEPDNPRAVHPVDEFALASRLSYFLWSTMPDEELFALAGKGRLRKNLDVQVRRMLQSPKARALVENFAGQWLGTRSLANFAPDPNVFPNFDEALRAAMLRETEMFFENIMRDDRSILEFIDADYTFLNEQLAKHYGIAGVTGPEFQRVSLQGTPRGGLLTHGSILALTSNPTRTSPVKRGKWVLENLLGTPPPPPPPQVPELKETKEAVSSGTLRQRMEQHRANPNCASCHERMDPIGFGLENFDALGVWREQDGKFPIDPAGKLPSGQEFHGPAELKKIFLGNQDQFARCLSEKLLTYALGRGLEYYDRPAIDETVRQVAKGQYKFSRLVLEVVKSTPFQKRRGEGDRLAQSAAR